MNTVSTEEQVKSIPGFCPSRFWTAPGKSEMRQRFDSLIIGADVLLWASYLTQLMRKHGMIVQMKIGDSCAAMTPSGMIGTQELGNQLCEINVIDLRSEHRLQCRLAGFINARDEQLWNMILTEEMAEIVNANRLTWPTP